MERSLADFIAEEEECLLQKARREIEEENAAWAALSPEQQQAWLDEREARFAGLDQISDDDDAEEGDGDDEEEEEGRA
jgi:hypothetical protein